MNNNDTHTQTETVMNAHIESEKWNEIKAKIKADNFVSDTFINIEIGP